MYEEDELRYILTESWHHFQNEPGYDRKSNMASISSEVIIHQYDWETGDNLDNGEVRIHTQTVDWPSYLFGKHIGHNELFHMSRLKNRIKIEPKYLPAIYINDFLNSSFKWIKNNFPPSIYNWEEYLTHQLDQIQNELNTALPVQDLEPSLISFVSNKFEFNFREERSKIRSLDIASKKIPISLNQSDIATLFGLILNSNIIDTNERKRLANILEREFCTIIKGQGHKKIKPMNLTSMSDKLNTATSRLRNKDSAIIKVKKEILKKLESE